MRVLADTQTQCQMGPRIPGTESHRRTRDWIVAQLKALGWHVQEQSFTADLALTGTRAPAWNLWATPPQTESAASSSRTEDRPKQSTDVRRTGKLILLSAHWDTRPYADQEPPGGPRTPFLGANDGAASVGFVLEILRKIKGTPLESCVAVVFVDAEDAGVSRDPDSWCVGAQYAAKHPPAWMSRVAFGINFDMVASEGLELRREEASLRSAPGPMKRLWRIGHDLAPSIFINQDRPGVIDDHLPFIEAGYPYIDLIGLPNPNWHRLSDTPENCNADTLRSVGEVMLEFLSQECAAIGRN